MRETTDSFAAHRLNPKSGIEHISSEGSVVAPHRLAVDAGNEMLRQNGNAVDAAVAAALVSGVIEPTETTLAGCGFLLFNDPRAGLFSADFGPLAPLAASPNMFEVDELADGPAVLGVVSVRDNANIDGALASGVPRTLLGLLRAHEQWGSLPRNVIMEPAIAAAADGFIADPWFVLSALADQSRLRADPGASGVFFGEDGLPIGSRAMTHAGQTFAARERVPQQKLAETLRCVSELGPEALVEGPIGDALLASNNERGGILTKEDLRRSEPRIGAPLTFRFRDVEVSVPPSPSGGMTELQILSVWESLYPAGSDGTRTQDGLEKFALATMHAFADRYHWLGDPEQVPVPIDGLLHPTYAEVIANLCRSGSFPDSNGQPPWAWFAGRMPHNPLKYSEVGSVAWEVPMATTPTSGTTHISAVDRQGGIVSITHTAANQFGSGILCPRTGLLFDSAMAWFNAAPGAANSVRPGARPVANMGPALITQSGRSLLAVGATGGRRIVSAVAQTLINFVDGSRDPQGLLEIPRIDASGNSIVLHEGCPPGATAAIGLPTKIVREPRPVYSLDLARVNLAAPLGDSYMTAIDRHSFAD